MAHGRVKKLLPDIQTIERTFGERAARERKVNLDGSTSEGVRNRKVWDDLMHPWRQAESDRGHTVQAGIARTWMRHRNGAQVQVPVQLEDHAGKARGLLPVWRVRGQRVRFDQYGRLPNGHTHLGEPWEWQRACCPGCQLAAVA